MDTILITGGCGFIGTNASAYFMKRGYRVVALDNLSRVGASSNLDWLKKQDGDFRLIMGDIRNRGTMVNAVEMVKPDYILHLAAQVTMVTSITNPREDFEVNAMGTFNLLEAMRITKSTAHAIYSSTNKVLGDLSDVPIVEKEHRYIYRDIDGIDETYPLNFHGPYGCSKGCADQYFLDYARIF